MIIDKLFRLKKEAVPFFDKKFATHISTLGTWEDCKININALEEVEPIHIEYGIKYSGCASNLSGWSDETSKIHFTVSISGTNMADHNKIIDNINVRELMDEIQSVLNKKIL